MDSGNYISIDNKYIDNYLEPGLIYTEMINYTTSNKNFSSITVKPLEIDMKYSQNEIVFENVINKKLYISKTNFNKGFESNNWESINRLELNTTYNLNENIIIDNTVYKVISQGIITQNPKTL